MSLFWNIISFRKEHGGFTLKQLSDAIGVNRASPTRWFSSARPNWQSDTISDIAEALGVDLVIRARDRTTKILFAPYGIVDESEREIPEPRSIPDPVANKEEPSSIPKSLSRRLDGNKTVAIG